ncbi:odorant receptor 22c-like [Microplitis demolitor]|uniref:odorant receptor 22c-like n=1 Tax=Microplitis demolitor TaxID=69319 RepID=UPI0004CC96A0|nr:odorant receptor 22c-like [Microplitis demolitor]
MENNIRNIEEEELPTCDKLFSLELLAFKLIGLGSLQSAFEKNNKIAVTFLEIFLFLCGFGVLIVLVFSASYTVSIFLSIDLTLACEILTFIFSTTITLGKVLRLWIYRMDLIKILREFNDLWEENARKRQDLKEEIYKIINDSKPIRYSYFIVAGLLSMSYGMRPYFLMLCYFLKQSENKTMDLKETVYPIIYPIPSGTWPGWLSCVTYEQGIIFFGMIYWIACDTLFILLTSHICVHFMIISNDLYKLHDNHHENNNDNYKLIGELSRRHQKMFVLCQKIETLYSPIVLLTVLFNGVDLCFCIFALDKEISEGHWIKVARSITHALTLFIQIIIYCNFAHMATEQTKTVSDAIYNSSWLNCDTKMKKIMGIIMMRANKEYKFAAYGLLILDREQMTRIVKTTMSYFTLLRSFS